VLQAAIHSVVFSFGSACPFAYPLECVRVVPPLLLLLLLLLHLKEATSQMATPAIFVLLVVKQCHCHEKQRNNADTQLDE
jgi:hypothetical protein